MAAPPAARLRHLPALALRVRRGPRKGRRLHMVLSWGADISASQQDGELLFDSLQPGVCFRHVIACNFPRMMKPPSVYQNTVHSLGCSAYR